VQYETNGFACGVCGGVLTVSMSSAAKTPSKPAVYLEPAEEQVVASRVRAR